VQELRQYRAAAELEQYLGDPSEAEGAFSFRRAVELDEREEYPEEACRLLNEWGLQDYYIPQSCDGRLSSFEEVFSLVRVVARRDLTVAIAHAKTYLGAVAVWVGGNAKQQKRLAEIIKARGQVALGLTERRHGSDLLASEVEARSDGRGYLLSGEKWLINNATRGAALSLFARTDAAGGPRGFSLFLVQKKGLEKDSYLCLPKIKTHGIRGADISGIRFRECPVPPDALIEPAGSGLEVMLKALQVTRTLIPCLSLGAADTALRTTLRFALERRLYGESVFEVPHARTLLLNAFLDLLICDCLSVAASRALHVSTEQMSVWSAIVKYFVPATIERAMRRLALVLGARHYLREEHQWGIFQKMTRDAALVSLFDGSAAVNLNVLGSQLRQLLTHRERSSTPQTSDLSERMESIFSLDRPLPEFEPRKLQLFNRGCNDLLQGIDCGLARLSRLSSEPGLDAGVLRTICRLAASVKDELNSQHQDLEGLAARYGAAFSKSAELFEVAKSYCRLHAAAACLQMWLCNRHSLGEFFAGGEWLALSLERLLRGSKSGVRPFSTQTRADGVARELLELYEGRRLFSLIPVQLA